MIITGKSWLFGDNINTDLILPGRAQLFTEEEQKLCVFEANRPGWLDEIDDGDIIIGGQNFGMGSSRPAARSLRNIGLACLVAESINGLFFRNCVNWGFLALECPGVSSAFEEGDVAEISFEGFTVKNARTGEMLTAGAIPEQLLATMQAGGIFPVLEAEGLVAPAG
ncbi:MAG: 3-isopropylmalate dehydratase [Rhodospirillaceae bacterium]|jgi:3-isopropylmalate/(R)-2-methylmalate dehydratase small subunit|nr:3-isopropylmalate dehydratase [Rhodospirillaceae bacterium]